MYFGKAFRTAILKNDRLRMGVSFVKLVEAYLESCQTTMVTINSGKAFRAVFLKIKCYQLHISTVFIVKLADIGINNNFFHNFKLHILQ